MTDIEIVESLTLQAAIDLVTEIRELGPTKSTLRLTQWVCSDTILSVCLIRDMAEPHTIGPDMSRFRFEIRGRDGQLWCLERIIRRDEPLFLALGEMLHEVRQHTRVHG